jgi:hypothetical protein
MRQIIFSPVFTHGNRPGHHGKGRNFTFMRVAFSAEIVPSETGSPRLSWCLKVVKHPSVVVAASLSKGPRLMPASQCHSCSSSGRRGASGSRRGSSRRTSPMKRVATSESPV